MLKEISGTAKDFDAVAFTETLDSIFHKSIFHDFEAYMRVMKTKNCGTQSLALLLRKGIYGRELSNHFRITKLDFRQKLQSEVENSQSVSTIFLVKVLKTGIQYCFTR